MKEKKINKIYFDFFVVNLYIILFKFGPQKKGTKFLKSQIKYFLGQ